MKKLALMAFIIVGAVAGQPETIKKDVIKKEKTIFSKKNIVVAACIVGGATLLYALIPSNDTK